MAIFRDAVSGANTSAGVTAGTLAHICSGNNRLLFAGVLDQAGSTVTGATYAGSTMTLIAAGTSIVGPEYLFLYYLVNPNSGTNNIVVNRTGTTGVIALRNSSYNGALQTGIPDTSLFGTTATGTLSLSLTTTKDRDWSVLLARGNGADLGTLTNTAFAGTISADKQFDLFDNNGFGDITPAGNYTQAVSQTGTGITGIMAAFSPIPGGDLDLTSKMW